MDKKSDEPAVLAYRCFMKKDYNAATKHLNVLEKLAGSSNKTLKHNKMVIEFMAGDMKNIDKLKTSLAELTGTTFPDLDMKDVSSPFLYYNYAVVFYHLRYYFNAVVILDKLVASIKNIKDKKLAQHIVILLMEATICRRTYDKTLDIAKHYGNIVVGSEVNDVYQRLVARAQLLSGENMTVTLKPDLIENVFIIAQQHFKNGNAIKAVNTLGQYKTIKHDYNLKTQGEDIWAAINNNLGVSYLLMKKPFMATKYFQHAIKEHLRVKESEDNERLITCRDRPLYVHNLGIAQLAANNPDGAFECLVEAARHYPNNPRIWKHLAECCVQKCCKEDIQLHFAKKLGTGPHARIIIAQEVNDKYSTDGESFAIPTLSLEFAVLCLRNALVLLPNKDPPADQTVPYIQAPPGPPINWKQRCIIKNAMLVLQSYIFLQLQDPLSALTSARELLSQQEISNCHKAWGHIYAAEALINLDRIADATEHLKPAMIHKLVSDLPGPMKDRIGLSVWSKSAVCHMRTGDMITARKILQQINSPSVLPLQLYMETCAGNYDNCRALLRQLRLNPSSQ